MICPHCGRSTPDDSRICAHCCSYIGKYSDAEENSAIRSMRQGRGSVPGRTLPDHRGSQPRELGDYELHPLSSGHSSGANHPQAEPKPQRGMPVMDGPKSGRRTFSTSSNIKHPHKKSAVNWMLIVLVLVVLVGGAVVAFKVYTDKSDEGQQRTARKYVLAATEEDFALASAVTNDEDVLAQQEELLNKWKEIKADAYWDVGQDYLSYGDMNACIKAFRIADTVDPDHYDGLMLLANAYELNEQNDKAEEVYLYLINTVRSDRSDAYSSLISLYQNQGRDQEAADMMQTAYRETGKDTFRLLRADFIPATPVVDLTAGRYELAEGGLRLTNNSGKKYTKAIKQITLSSSQGFDVYYTLDDNAKLPEEGKLVERILQEDGTLGYGGLEVQEGTLNIRAVAVSGNLCSDEFSATYSFYYPTPPAPNANLASGTYKTLHSVSLRAGTNTDESLTNKELKERESKYRYFYTIDGSSPTTNSPEYTGEPIPLPSGRVTLKAICLNEYGKISSILEIGYKFNVSPYLPAVWDEADTFEDFTLNDTTIDEFVSAFGEPKQKLESEYYSTETNAKHYEYPWGYAVFILVNKEWQLVRVEMTKQICTGPRGAALGMTEEEITTLFRDYGQPSNLDGTRGLYYSYPDVGQILQKTDGTRYIMYQLSTATSKMWRLEFYLSNGRVNKIAHYYIP